MSQCITWKTYEIRRNYKEINH